MFRIKIILIGILITLYLLFPESQHYGFVQDGSLWQHFTYPFFHASLFHLAINSYVFYGLMRNPPIKPLYLLPLSYLLSVVASFPSTVSLPTVGFSGILFAMCGVGIGYYPTKMNLLLSSVAIGATFLMRGSNPYIHLYSWVMGFVVGFIVLKMSRVRKQH